MLTRGLTFCLFLALPACGWAGNWPQWRGPNGGSTSEETGLPLSWSESAGLRWKVPVPEWGTSTPAIWGDALFVTSQQDDKLLLLRLDRRSGSTAWTRQVGLAQTPRKTEKRTTQKFHELHNNASPSPVTDGTTVVCHFGNGLLAAYDFDGRQLWQHDLQAEHGRYTIWWGHANSPVMAGDFVISVCMQDSLAGVSDELAPSYLVAHDKLSGRQAWKTLRVTEADAEQCDSYTTPIFSSANGPIEMIVMGGNQVDAYDPTTGKQRWFLPGLVGGRTITGPALGNGQVYVTVGMRGALQAVRLGGSGRLDADKVAWKFSENTPDTCCPVLWDRWLFVISDSGIAQCLAADTGELLWKERLRGKYKASPVAADGRVYFLNTEGLATVVAASGEFRVLAENQLDDDTIASPAISAGHIFVRGRTHLYCIGEP